DYRQTVADLSDQIPQTIKNRRTIRVYQASTYMEKLYDATIRRSFDAMEQSNFYDSIYSPVIITTSSIVIAIMMTLAAMGGRWTAFFGMGAGTAVTAIAYVNNVFGPLADIGMEIQNIQAAAAGIARIGTFMAHAEEEHGTGAGGENAPAAVDLEHVSFSYDPKEPLIHDFSLRVNTGEMVTLVGRTGSGKSTIFKLVLGLYAPDAGEVRVLGQRPQDITEEERRHVFGYVEQQFHPVEGTLKDQVSINDPHVDEDQVRRALKTVGLLDVLEHLPAGLDTPYSPGVLSQGQFQLLSIARAIVCDPKVLLLDEITANLDSNTEKQVMDAIFHACSGRTVLSISHRLYEHTGGRMVFIGKDAEKK
ncbi:ABC transporter ATP-binding protein, partial [Galactobacillus timonensis]|uniref:ATP-binding cassette domain-containing protein n=1 Tax=Galactobacillus timonensis TaxID=2041840 RepID=UPI00240A20CF